MYVLLCRCIHSGPFNEHQHVCSPYLSHTIFKYTSDINIKQYTTIIDQLKGLQKYMGNCYYATLEFACKLLYVPCNLTTGTPRPMCSDICFNFRNTCKDNFNVMKDLSVIYRYPFFDSCENTLGHLISYGYPNSSSEFRDDCLSLAGMYLITQISFLCTGVINYN